LGNLETGAARAKAVFEAAQIAATIYHLGGKKHLRCIWWFERFPKAISS